MVAIEICAWDEMHVRHAGYRIASKPELVCADSRKSAAHRLTRLGGLCRRDWRDVTAAPRGMSFAAARVFAPLGASVIVDAQQASVGGRARLRALPQGLLPSCTVVIGRGVSACL